MTDWLIWGLGAVVLLGAGFMVVALPKHRDRDLRRRTAWSEAHAAIDSASVSRDAAPGTHPEAEQLFARAETIAAGHGGTRAAKSALDCARRADTLWQEASRG